VLPSGLLLQLVKWLTKLMLQYSELQRFNYCTFQKLAHRVLLHTHTHTHTTVLRPFVQNQPGEPVPEQNFMVQGKINRGRQHSIQTNQCLPPPSPIYGVLLVSTKIINVPHLYLTALCNCFTDIQHLNGYIKHKNTDLTA